MIRGSKLVTSRVRQVPQITRVRDCMDVPYKLPPNADFETSYVQGQSRVPSRGIPSRESIEPSDPNEWVRAPPSEPL